MNPIEMSHKVAQLMGWREEGGWWFKRRVMSLDEAIYA